MPKERKPRIDIISDFKDLSCQSDSIIADHVKNISCYDSGIRGWFEAVKNHIKLIKNCNSTDEIGDGPKLSDFLGATYKTEKVQEEKFEEQKAHVHSSASSENKNKPAIDAQVAHSDPIPDEISDTVPVTSKVIMDTLPQNVKTQSKAQQNEISMTNVINSSVTENNSPFVETPVLDRTFVKVINKTLVMNSDCSSMKKLKIMTPKTLVLNSECSSMKKLKIMTPKINEVKTKLIPSNNMLEAVIHNGVITRSGSKRKSSESASKANKKLKPDTLVNNKTTGNKLVQQKLPLSNKNSKPVATSVIMPTVPQKVPVVSKEQLIQKELKRKEEKANENIKRVMTERQLKAEQNKKVREEKQSKTLQKRLQIEKEKEELQKKREVEIKTTQVKTFKESLAKKPVSKPRTQELIDQHAAVNKSKISTVEQNAVNGETPKTPARKKSSDYENYELTPLPNSSTYNFSDDEEEDKPQGKHIPLWAQGILLKSALMEQFYHPIDPDELFGSVVDPPNLAQIFGVNKTHYSKRTSSAVWKSPPRKLKC